MSDNSLAQAIKNGKFVVTADCTPPRGTGSDSFKACVTAIGSMVDAICAPESEDGARLCSLAACGHLAAAGANPVLHLLTRDLNRIALQSQILGAASMGIQNILCLSGRHQALTSSNTAKGVFDVDPIQLLQIADGIRKSGKLADGQSVDSPIDITLGIDTNPFSDPVELQVLALEKAVNAGADYVITQPVFNLDKFNIWMTYVRERGLHTKACIIASVMPITSSKEAVKLAEKFCHLDIRDEDVDRLDTASDQRTAGINMAAETIKYVSKVEGVRGVHIMSGEDFQITAEIIKASGISRS